MPVLTEHRLRIGDRAVTLFNESDAPQRITTSASAVGMPAAPAYRVRDLWAHKDLTAEPEFTAEVPSHGVVMLKVW